MAREAAAQATPFGPSAEGAFDAASPFWTLDTPALCKAVSSSDQGLSETEATGRLARFGHNEISTKARFGFLLRLWQRVTEPLVLILIVAALVSALTGDAVGFWMILVVLVLSVILDLVQEQRAASDADALKLTVALKSDVLRAGTIRAIASRDLVVGDVIALRAGDLVPADGVALSVLDLSVNQAQLTGEPYPMAKSALPSASHDVSEATNALFMGSSIVSGSGRMLIVATGAASRFGAIAAELARSPPPTAFERDMHAFSMLVVRLTGALVVLVMAAHLAFARPIIDSFLFALALAVGLTPELLPMIMTVSLSRGAKRLAEGGVIVKRLGALHDLGAMDVLCTDKTGTLTDAKISLVGHTNADGIEDEKIFRLLWLNSHFETGIRSPLDDAILAHGQVADASGWTKISELPFDFERRRVSVLLDDGKQRLLIVKGAPEDVLAHTTHVDAAGASLAPLDDARRKALVARHDKLAEEGKRVLAIACKVMPQGTASLVKSDENGLTFAGFAAFLDPPKASAAEALRALAAARLAVKIVSGDNERVVGHLATLVGLPVHGVLTGREIASMDDIALQAAAARTTLFCRVDPAQKSRIIRAIQARAHVVGYLGDGVNDAPSIKAADVGISVESAADVAREAADLILTRPDLGMVAKAVGEGRRTFANIMKYVLMGTSSNFGNMASMAVASMFLPFLPMLPMQILLNNLIYDFSEIGIPFDTVDPEDGARPQVWDMEAMKRFTFVMGFLSSIFDIGTFIILRQVFDAGPELFRTAWFVESMATQVLVIFIIRTRRFAFASAAHPVLVISSLSALAVACLLPITPLAPLLGFVALPGTMIMTIAGIVGLYLLSAEALKRFARPTPRRRRSAR